MKLYFSPGACSLSPHIALRETGLHFELEKVDTKARQTKSGADYLSINPKGAVPALQLDDGQVLTEGAAIVQYIADRKPEAQLAPAAGTMERYRLQEALNYVATEIHKGFSPLWNPKLPDDLRAATKEAMGKKFDYLTRQLSGRQFLLGEKFTVADTYLFTVLQWTKKLGFELQQWPVLQTYVERIAARPAVKAALEFEAAARQA